MKALFFPHKNMQIDRERRKTSSKEISFSSSLKCLWKRWRRIRIGKEYHADVMSLATYSPPPLPTQANIGGASTFPNTHTQNKV